MRYTNVLELDIQSQKIKNIILFYRCAIESMISGDLEICYSNRESKLHISDVSWLLLEITNDDSYPTDNVTPTIHAMLVSLFQDAERLSPGAGIVSLLLFTDMMLDPRCVKMIEDDVNENLHHSRLVSYEDWLVVVNEWMKCDSIARDIFITSIHLNGLGSQIHLKKDTSKKTMIESLSGHTLKLGMHEGMVNVVGDFWEVNNCHVCLIDGIIENVGEIHHLLEYFHEKKLPLLIAARGFADDVISTLSMNISRKTLNCMPFIVGVNENSINTLVDMAVICGGDVVSSLKGELISSIDPNSLPVVSHITHTHSSLTISTIKNSQAIAFHKSRIANKPTGSHEILADYYHERINFLSGECVNITLGKEHGDLLGLRYDRVGFLVRLHNIMLRLGIVDINNIRQLNVLKAAGVNKAPAKSILDGYTTAIKHLNLACDVSHFIIKD